jgi:osmotically inducible lipoprotein OsmB
MKTTRIPSRLAVTTMVLVFGFGGCAGMSRRDQNTAAGAGIGAVGGAVLTNGNPVGVLGGAAVGGVIGNQVDTGDSHHHH